MLGSAKHFALGAAAIAGAAVVLDISERAAVLSGGDAPVLPLDPAHLLGVGVPLFLVGSALVHFEPRLVPDPSMRKGTAPRVFWALVFGVGVRAFAAKWAAPKEPFWSAVTLGASFLELAAIGMLVLPVVRPASLTPPAASGTKSEPSGS